MKKQIYLLFDGDEKPFNVDCNAAIGNECLTLLSNAIECKNKNGSLIWELDPETGEPSEKGPSCHILPRCYLNDSLVEEEGEACSVMFKNLYKKNYIPPENNELNKHKKKKCNA